MIRKLPLIRRISQILFWGLFVATLWFTTYPMTGKLSPEVFFITNPLVMVLTAMSERFVLPGLWFAGAMLALTLVLGRFFCGWICPLGAMIDFTAWLKRFSPGGKRILLKKSRAVKFFILGVVVALACLGIQDAWVLDPLGMIARFVSLNFIPFVTRVIDGVFVFMLTVTHRYEPLFDLYRFLKASVLGVKVSYFSHSGIILLLFAVACGISWIAQRFWCRALCPLGALYAVVARWAWLRRVVPECSRCGNCAARCRMGAINADMSYEKHECILCLDCLYDCPQRVTRFIMPWPLFGARRDPAAGNAAAAQGVSRRDFLPLLAAGLIPLILGGRKKNLAADYAGVLRPPGALREETFLNRCVRCGNCMKVCPTNALQPVLGQAGISGIWTPQLVPQSGYCEYNCTLCGQVCPTGAIPRLPLAKKQKLRLGIAKIDRNLCLPWAKNKECLVCEEHCPIPEKAIIIKKELVDNQVVLRPYVDPERCTGCGICQTKCPLPRVRAIKIFPVKADRL